MWKCILSMSSFCTLTLCLLDFYQSTIYHLPTLYCPSEVQVYQLWEMLDTRWHTERVTRHPHYLDWIYQFTLPLAWVITEIEVTITEDWMSCIQLSSTICMSLSWSLLQSPYRLSPLTGRRETPCSPPPPRFRHWRRSFEHRHHQHNIIIIPTISSFHLYVLSAADFYVTAL